MHRVTVAGRARHSGEIVSLWFRSFHVLTAYRRPGSGARQSAGRRQNAVHLQPPSSGAPLAPAVRTAVRSVLASPDPVEQRPEF
eukprot:7380481-Prymnesium_polylepis.1